MWCSGIKKSIDIVFMSPNYPSVVEVNVLELVGILNNKIVEPSIPDSVPAFLLGVRISGAFMNMNILTDGKTFWSHTNPLFTAHNLNGWQRQDSLIDCPLPHLPEYIKKIIEQKVTDFAQQIRIGENDG